MRVLIVGAGCTGATAALRLRERLGPELSIHVWEKARGAGGRYTTSRDRYPDGLRADLGAQYASVDPGDADSMALMESIVKEEGAELMPEACLVDTAERLAATVQYRGTTGQNGIVKTMLSMANAEVAYERRVSKLDLKGGSWTATAYDGATEQFACVILCVPGCGPGGDNLNKIHGNWERQLSAANWQDVEVPHDCRYSLALWLEPGHQSALETFFKDMVERKLDGGSVELVVWQSRKDREPPDGPQVLVLHTPKGACGNKQQVQPRMTGEICRTLEIPQKAVTSSKIITWFQSQVLTTGSKSECLVACESPPLILAGDYFTASTFTGCVQSASAAAMEASRLLAGCRASHSNALSRPVSASGARTLETKPQSRDSQSGPRCAECGGKSKCFSDESDGKLYCGPCWKAYYGESRAAGS